MPRWAEEEGGIDAEISSGEGAQHAAEQADLGDEGAHLVLRDDVETALNGKNRCWCAPGGRRAGVSEPEPQLIVVGCARGEPS